MTRIIAFVTLVLLSPIAKADDANKLYAKIYEKVSSIKDYAADIKMKVKVPFINMPRINGRLYYKAPDKMRLERNGGISVLPKKNINFTLRNMLPSGNVTVLDMGLDTLAGKKLRIFKIIPNSEQSDIVISKIWIEEQQALIFKTETTTRNEGTVIMSLDYGAYTKNALPDKIILSFDIKEYKLPKGITMDYDQNDIAQKYKNANGASKTGTVEIVYLNYKINSGIPDDTFK